MKSFIVPTVLFAIFLILSMQTSAMSRVPTGATKLNVEALHGLYLDLDTITIEARSSGCTTEASFEFRVVKSWDQSAAVTIVRVVPDLCKAIEQNVTLYYTRSDVGLAGIEQITLTNPLRGFPRR